MPLMNMKIAPNSEDLPFSTELLELYQAFTQETSLEERRELAKRIAATLASERDELDFSASEEYHEFFEAYEAAVLKFEQQSSRLARLAVNLIGVYLRRNDSSVEDVLPAATASN